MNRDEIVRLMAEAMRNFVKRNGIVPKYDDYATAALAALEQAGLQIVGGEPVAWKYETPDGFPRGIFGSKLDELPHKSWTETPLFAGKVLQ